jgi:hypothetical protein
LSECIDKQKISIDDYLNNTQLNQLIDHEEKFLVCDNDLEMVKVKCDDRSSHFRHKHCNGMSEWHREWQSHFSMKEIVLGTNRADVVIHDLAIEFQHSKISKPDVTERTDNLLKYQNSVYWIVDGCNLDIQQYPDINREIISFSESEQWKYKNFESCDFIFLDINSIIYQIIPSRVKRHMIDTSPGIEKKTFIDMIYKNETWEPDKLAQCVLYWNQRGAGNGKTYESIQLLKRNDDRFASKDTFIYLTKMHSAKEVIYNELKSQYNRKQLDELTEPTGFDNEFGKQYQITFKDINKNKDIRIIIGTIDSFNHAIGNKHHNERDYFGGIVRSINNGFVKSIASDGKIIYTNKHPKLNKRCLIIIDEAQDLDPDYIKAIGTIMSHTYVDTYVIGDKLQSIWNEYNVFTFLEKNGLPKLPTINMIKDTGINQVKRFHNTHFMNFVNNMVDFHKYDLPEISDICDGNCLYTPHKSDECVNVFQIPKIIGDNNEDKMTMVINKTLNYMDQEVTDNGYLPQDFMFIFPILTMNPLVGRLEAKIQEFWINKFKDPIYALIASQKSVYYSSIINTEDYIQYVFVHKSDEGRSINLKESENATRILSIHASKGNGSSVVFVFGLNERSLKRFSKGKIDLVYESLLHVAITRQKLALYIGIEKDMSDDIYNRLKNHQSINIQAVSCLFDISTQMKYDDIIHSVVNGENNDADDSDIMDSLVEFMLPFIPKIDNADKTIIEWGHHLIRYSVFFYYIMQNIINNETVSEEFDQFKTVALRICNMKVCVYEHDIYFNAIKEISEKISRQEKFNIFPILAYKDVQNSIYYQYTDVLRRYINTIQQKIKRSLPKSMPDLCPLECVIFLHMCNIIIQGKYCDITISQIYNLMSYYFECRNVIEQNAHEKRYKCLCVQTCKTIHVPVKEHDDIQKSIIHHYEKTHHVEKTYENYKVYCKQKFPNENFIYNINHMNFFGEKNDNFSIRYRHIMISYSDKRVIHFIITPQFNKLNVAMISISALMAGFMIMSCDEESNNGERYRKKEIEACVFTLDTEQPIWLPIDFNDTGIKDFAKKNVKHYIVNQYQKFHQILHNTYIDYWPTHDDNPKTVVKLIYKNLNDKTKVKQCPQYLKNIFEDLVTDKSKNDVYIEKLMQTYENFANCCNAELEKKLDYFLSIE